MQSLRLTGPDAGSVKYDLITALTVVGLNGSPTLQMSMARLVALITARYNWRLDEVSIGQRDLARMWSVNERTVKREMKRLTTADILICKRAGVRGRVGAYQLNFPEIVRLSESVWSLVGPDFEARMYEKFRPVRSNVVALHALPDKRPEPNAGANSPWTRAMQTLSMRKPDVFGAWFARLSFADCSGQVLTIKSPSAFVSRYIETHFLSVLTDALEPEFGTLTEIILEHSGS